MSYKVFLSPSNQNANVWAVGNTNEQEQAESFANRLEELLEGCGITVVRADAVTPKSRINRAAGCDLYVPLHTNGYDGTIRGCRLFIYDKKAKAALAKKNAAAMAAVGAEVSKLGMYPDVRYYTDFANWFELTNAANAGIPAFYSESIFHDNVADCNWYFQNVDKLAAAYAAGICAYFGVDYSEGAEPESKPAPAQLYRVRKSWADATSQIGAYRFIDNAVAACDDAGAGFAVFDERGQQVYPAAGFKPYLVTVTADMLNVRAGAGMQYKINMQIPKGGAYTIVECSGAWGKLKSGAGWVCLDYCAEL